MPPAPSLLDRALRPFAPVRPGEGLIALLLFVDVFLILSGYYILKTAREGLILGSGGMLGLHGDELKIYASGAMALLLIGVIPAYAALASKVPRIKLINVSYGAVLASLAIFFVLGRAGVPVALGFFLWLGVVNVFLVAQFWSFASDIYTEDQGKRLFAVIAAGASAGAILGPRLARLADTYVLMLIAAGLLAICVALFNLVEYIGATSRGARPASSGAPLAPGGGFDLVRRDRYLGLIALLLIVANLVNTTGEFVLSSTAAQHAIAMIPDGAHAEILDLVARKAAIAGERREIIKLFYADFYFWMNLVGFLVQAFLVSRLMVTAGVRTALLVLPGIALVGYGAIGLVGGMTLVRIAKIAENSIDYSLQNTVRHALFLPTSREAKYKAKAAIDTFFVRFGDAAAATMVFVGIHFLGLGVRWFALINVGLVAVWLGIALAVGRRYQALTPDKDSDRGVEPSPVPDGDPQLVAAT